MDRVVSERARDARLEDVAKALAAGIVLVDAEGAVVWMDRAARRRMDGQLRDLPLPLPGPDGKAVSCLAAPVELSINGRSVRMCVLQQADAPKENEGQDLIAAVEAIMADSASWLSRTVIEKLKATGRPGFDPRRAANGAGHGDGSDMLSHRESEVLGLICEGKSGAHIGAILGLSENTVRNHIASLYRKIGVSRRSAAIIWARERGIVGRDSLALERVGRSRERPAARGRPGDAAG